MSDIFTNVMAISAASSAEEAADESRAARAAAEERLESSGHNPFLIFGIAKIESIPQKGEGFFSFLTAFSRNQVSGIIRKLSIKKTDISHLVEKTDDYGTVYTRLYLEKRSRLYNDGDLYLNVVGTLQEVQSYINSL
jgi:hypothetical protein